MYSISVLSALNLFHSVLSTIPKQNRLDAVDVDKAVEYVLRCMNFDGGFGRVPGSESHAGQVSHFERIHSIHTVHVPTACTHSTCTHSMYTQYMYPQHVPTVHVHTVHVPTVHVPTVHVPTACTHSTCTHSTCTHSMYTQYMYSQHVHTVHVHTVHVPSACTHNTCTHSMYTQYMYPQHVHTVHVLIFRTNCVYLCTVCMCSVCIMWYIDHVPLCCIV